MLPCRYDDTNPEAEKQEYIDHIQEIVQWLGWKPFKVGFPARGFKAPLNGTARGGSMLCSTRGKENWPTDLHCGLQRRKNTYRGC